MWWWISVLLKDTCFELFFYLGLYFATAKMWIKHDPTKVFQYLSTGYELLWRTCLSFY